jgi:hypothetical protein
LLGLEMTTLKRKRERVVVGPFVEKTVETWFRWFGHVERRFENSVTRVDQMG